MNQRILQLLLRQEPMLGEEWLELLNLLVTWLKPHLPHFQLVTIGKVPCLTDWNGTHGMVYDTPTVVADEGLNLETQGIWRVLPEELARRIIIETPTEENVGVEYLWGLSRKGEWLFVTIKYVITAKETLPTYNSAQHVTIKHMTLEQMLGEIELNPFDVWSILFEAVAMWQSIRRRLADEADAVGARMLMMRDLLNVVPR